MCFSLGSPTFCPARIEFFCLWYHKYIQICQIPSKTQFPHALHLHSLSAQKILILCFFAEMAPTGNFCSFRDRLLTIWIYLGWLKMQLDCSPCRCTHTNNLSTNQNVYIRQIQDHVRKTLGRENPDLLGPVLCDPIFDLFFQNNF